MNELSKRKDSHIEICLQEEIEFSSLDANGFGKWRFDHDALPEVDKSKIDLSIEIFGKRLSAPIFIGAMTGGTDRAAEINKRLAIAAQNCRVGFALGSQRKMLADRSSKPSYDVRKHAPDLPLLVGNVGAVQLNYGVKLEELKFLINEVGCNAFNFHLNPLQEAIQPEGDINFSGLLSKLKDVIPKMGVPVLFKEVGSGISETTAQKISQLPIAGVETAGLGGTSWSKIESMRTKNDVQRAAGELFARWGVSTAESILNCRKCIPENLAVIASGGIRNGIEVAKALTLGANAVAFALPLLKAAEKSTEAVEEEISKIIEELRIAMFVTGCANIESLKKRKLKLAQDYTALL